MPAAARGTSRNATAPPAVGKTMNPGHTVTITPSNLHVEVRIEGEKVAETDHPVLLEETGMPTRYYLPREDVRMDLLRPTNFKTECPFKGQASYWTLERPEPPASPVVELSVTVERSGEPGLPMIAVGGVLSIRRFATGVP